MRYIDFIVFYAMANFNRQSMSEVASKSMIIRAVFLGSFPVGFVMIAVVEVVYFVIFRINIYDKAQVPFLFAIWLILNNLIFQYIYVKKKRYQYILSPQYKAFTASVNSGLAIGFLVILFCIMGSIGIPLAIHVLLKK